MAWRLRLRRRRAESLEALVAERTGALREREMQLEARNTQLAEFVASRSRLFANLSHEFRTPLTLIIGPLRSLLEGRHGPLGPTVREQGELMERNGLKDCYLRPVAYRGVGAAGLYPMASPVHTVIVTWPWGSYLGAGALEQGVDVKVSSWNRPAPIRRQP